MRYRKNPARPAEIETDLLNLLNSQGGGGGRGGSAAAGPAELAESAGPTGPAEPAGLAQCLNIPTSQAMIQVWDVLVALSFGSSARDILENLRCSRISSQRFQIF